MFRSNPYIDFHPVVQRVVLKTTSAVNTIKSKVEPMIERLKRIEP